MTHRDAVLPLGLLLASAACACSLVHRPDRDDHPSIAGTAASAGRAADDRDAHAGTNAPVPAAGGAGVGGGGRAAGAGTGTDIEPPPIDDWSAGLPLPPLAPEVGERFEGLQEPDFAQPPDAIAEMHCGSILRIEEHTEVGAAFATADTQVTRVFDAQGRLLVAEESTTVVGDGHLLLELEAGDTATRLQLDYDAEGRVARVRQGALDEHRDQHGTVVDFIHAGDGSFRAEIATSHVHRDGEGLARGFCEHMEFDAEGRLLRTSWGCGQSEEARAFTYDAEGRLLEVRGRSVERFLTARPADPRFGESSEWTIRYDHGTPGEVAVVWNEIDLRGWNELSGEPPPEVEQRLVRFFDGAGRLVATEFDYGNDGSVDERAQYVYDDPSSPRWVRQTYDFGLDSVIDLVEERSRQGDTQHVERRHMAQWGDETRFHYSIGHFYALLTSGRHSSSPQSVSRWALQFDGDDRLVTAALDMRLVPMPPVQDGTPQEFVSSLVQRHAAAGYVEHVALETTNLAWIAIGQLEPVDSRRTTSCKLEPGCEGDALVLPADPALAACQTESGAASRLLLPYMHAPYLPPPFDRIEAMRTRHAHAATFDPRPPTVREIVGY